MTGPDPLTLFLCGDVMTGRGIDQVLPHPSDPDLHEPAVRDARTYVELAEDAFGRIRAPVSFDYVWGEALDELRRVGPHVRIVNLETAVTTSDDAWPGKGIHYRMHPENVPVLEAAGVDCCVLANNHVLDWGLAGLRETLETLDAAGIGTVGAGRNADEAAEPWTLERDGGPRIVVLAFGRETSGVSSEWVAGPHRPGVRLLRDLSEESVEEVAEAVRRVGSAEDLVVASIHWGPNWGYRVPRDQRRFARALIDDAGVDVVHGHSSHHPKGIEVHRGRPILYGCGDFVNDYEGISGYERFRDDLVVMYFPAFDPGSGELVRFRMTPLRLRRFRLERPTEEDVAWIRDRMDRECRELGGRVEAGPDGTLELGWG